MIIHLLRTDGDTHEFLLLAGKNEYVIGREEGDLVIADERCSRRHAMLYCNDQEQVCVRDLGSTNGVIVNKKRVEECVLSPEDTFRLGRTIFLFFGAQVESEAESPTARIERRPVDSVDESASTAGNVQIGSPVVLNQWPDNFRALKESKLRNFVNHLDEDQRKKSVRLIDMVGNEDDEAA